MEFESEYEWIEIKCKEDVLPILQEEKENRAWHREEKDLVKDKDSNHAFNKINSMNRKSYLSGRMSGFFKSKKIDALLEKGFGLRYNGVMLKIDTKNDFWGEFNYYPKSDKMYAKSWKKWYTYSWSWIEKKLINNDKL